MEGKIAKQSLEGAGNVLKGTTRNQFARVGNVLSGTGGASPTEFAGRGTNVLGTRRRPTVEEAMGKKSHARRAVETRDSRNAGRAENRSHGDRMYL
jgi:hypothetical protein